MRAAAAAVHAQEGEQLVWPLGARAPAVGLDCQRGGDQSDESTAAGSKWASAEAAIGQVRPTDCSSRTQFLAIALHFAGVARSCHLAARQQPRNSTRAEPCGWRSPAQARGLPCTPAGSRRGAHCASSSARRLAATWQHRRRRRLLGRAPLPLPSLAPLPRSSSRRPRRRTTRSRRPSSMPKSRGCARPSRPLWRLDWLASPPPSPAWGPSRECWTRGPARARWCRTCRPAACPTSSPSTCRPACWQRWRRAWGGPPARWATSRACGRGWGTCASCRRTRWEEDVCGGGLWLVCFLVELCVGLRCARQQATQLQLSSFPSLLLSRQGPFDVAVFNAVFGNLVDQREALLRTCFLMRPGG